MKWNHRKRMAAKGKGVTTPNLVMGANVQVCWEKFARYFEVEPRYVPCTPARPILSVEEAVALCDENTIGVAAILGSTYTGQYEPVAELDEAVSALNQRTGFEIPIHVDAASGGFVAPFIQPEIRWDFGLANVKSINVSGHKYGLVYPGVGWVLWRDATDLPEELIFHVDYLGADQPTFNLNFSKSASQVVAQYYNFLRLGRAGYRSVMERAMSNARYLTAGLQKQSDSASCRTWITAYPSCVSPSRRAPASPSSSSLTGFGNGAGSSPPITWPPTPSTWRWPASWCAKASPTTWPTCSSRT